MDRGQIEGEMSFEAGNAAEIDKQPVLTHKLELTLQDQAGPLFQRPIEIYLSGSDEQASEIENIIGEFISHSGDGKTTHKLEIVRRANPKDSKGPLSRFLNPVDLVGIEELLDGRQIASKLAHSAHILNAAVNAACRQFSTANTEDHLIPEKLEEIVKSLKGPGHITLAHQILMVTSLLGEVSFNVFAQAYALLSDSPEVVLADFDEQTRGVVKNWMDQDQETMLKYLGENGLGANGFTFFGYPKANLDSNAPVVPDIMKLVLDSGAESLAGLTPRESGPDLAALLGIFLNTPAEDFHAFLLKAARGVQGSIGIGAAGLIFRFNSQVTEGDNGSRFKYEFDPDSQMEITRQVTRQNDNVKTLQRILTEALLPYCQQQGMQVRIKPSVQLRPQKVCPVLQASYSSDKYDSHLHPGYESPKEAYMPQVELVYMILGMIRDKLWE